MNIRTWASVVVLPTLVIGLCIIGGIKVQASQTVVKEQSVSAGSSNLTYKWEYDLEEGATLDDYELEMSTDASFAEDDTIEFDSDNATFTKVSTSKFQIKIPFDKLGNGGAYYIRVKLAYTDASGQEYKMYSSVTQYTVVKINKSNFPGMYKLLKKGVYGKKKRYDADKDGYLTTQELQQITELNNHVIVKKNKKYTNSENVQYKVTSFKGIEYLTNLKTVDIGKYAKKIADLRACTAKKAYFDYVLSSNIKVNAPNATSVYVFADEYAASTKSVNVSSCKKAVELVVYGSFNKYLTVKMPKKNSHLRIVSLSYVTNKSIDGNKYKNLNQLYLYAANTSSVKLTKCKNLHYAYFYFDLNLKKIDLTKNKKLRAVDAFQCFNLKKANIKTSSGKKTIDHGKWWYKTKAYKKEVKKINQYKSC
ncbi:hypothetical protein [Eubacterium oxidoreducens]|uniref:EF-hand domain-containing protein n=1 Tax=Eubacterium oxidoreducens TaxID=1732 RepID=A0A1G6C6V2_EUBOX|nr:hypothetical protein [Eubacterium oxidoreducens]SDB28623.1 hypothetical protein SAMN02910417_02131 [Eubacterium oxidoreducens]